MLTLALVAAMFQMDVAGRWELILVDPLNQTHDIELVLEQDGEDLTGRAADDGSEMVTGRIRGDRITFTYHVDTPGRGRLRLAYEGRVNGDTMRGSVAFGRLANGTWTAER